MDTRIQTTVDTVVREWGQRKAFVGFTEEDAGLLLELNPIAQTYADEVVEEFYRQILQGTETQAFFPDTTTLNRVKGLQKTYFLGLTLRRLR